MAKYEMTVEERAVRAQVKDLHARCHALLDEANPNKNKLGEARRLTSEKAYAETQAKRATTSWASHPVRSHRVWLLAWAFVRGLPYRRIERKRHTQGVFEHNAPSVGDLARALAELGVFPPLEKGFDLNSEARTLIEAWLANPDGAIAAPPPRAKRPYVSADHAVAAE